MDRQLPLVSILIPCYNAEPWIEQCIQSALQQSYPNTEIIVVDDGSSDGSAAVVRKFGDQVRLRLSAHAGGNAVRNQLTEMSRGEWLQFLDADDFLLSGKIASQMERALAGGPETAVVYSPVILHDAAHPEADSPIHIEGEDEILSFIRWAPFCTSGLLFRRAALVGVGGWKVDQPCCQEHELLSRLLMAGQRFVLQNTAETVYRQHGAGTVSRKDPLRTIQLRMEITDRIAAYLNERGSLTAERGEAIYIARLESARTASAWDMPMADQLSAKAKALGDRWISNSPALPFPYQVILRLAGFRRTERIAGWLQARKQARVAVMKTVL